MKNLAVHFSAVLLLVISTPTAHAQTVGFASATSTTNEWASQHPVAITMTTAPATNTTVMVTYAGTGTATGSLDFDFTTQSITFTPAMFYPDTQYVGGLTLVSDAVTDPDETVNLALSILSGPGTLGTVAHQVLIKELDGRLMVNEISQGASGNQEYYELVVWGPPATTVDIRNWVVDDNNGLYNTGDSAISGVGIASGFATFENDCMWEKVPTGTIITIYNSEDKNASIVAVDDPKDSDEDYIHVLPLSIEFGTCGTPAANPYLNGYASSPDVPTASTAYFTPNQDPCFSMISLANNGDAAQVRNAAFTEMSGVSYGLGVTNHPRYASYGNDALAFTEKAGNRSFWMANTWGNDTYHKQNWLTSSPRTETPAAGNNAANSAWLSSMLQPFPVPSLNSTYTCHLNALEYRRYLNPNDEIFAHLRNNTANNHGSATVQMTIGHTIVQNNNLADAPFFAEPNWQVTLASAGVSPSMQVRLYTTPAILAALAISVNAAYGTVYTSSTIVPFVKIYQTTASGVEPRYGLGPQVNGYATTNVSYGSNYYFQATTTLGGGTFALGVPAPPLWAQPGVELQTGPGQEVHSLRVWYATDADQIGKVFIQSQREGRAQLKWYALDGRNIHRQELNLDSGVNVFVANIEGFAAGIYVVEVAMEGETVRQKVVIR